MTEIKPVRMNGFAAVDPAGNIDLHMIAPDEDQCAWMLEMNVRDDWHDLGWRVIPVTITPEGEAK